MKDQSIKLAVLSLSIGALVSLTAAFISYNVLPESIVQAKDGRFWKAFGPACILFVMLAGVLSYIMDWVVFSICPKCRRKNTAGSAFEMATTTTDLGEGRFIQSPNGLLNGQKCSKCGYFEAYVEYFNREERHMRRRETE